VALRVKVDEDLPADVANLFRDSGHDAQSVVEQTLSGVADPVLWKHVQEERRCLVTADKGFANERSYPPGTHGGIVLFRLPRESRSGYVRLAEMFLERAGVETVLGSITVVTPDSIRVRRGA